MGGSCAGGGGSADLPTISSCRSAVRRQTKRVQAYQSAERTHTGRARLFRDRGVARQRAQTTGSESGSAVRHARRMLRPACCISDAACCTLYVGCCMSPRWLGARAVEHVDEDATDDFCVEPDASESESAPCSRQRAPANMHTTDNMRHAKGRDATCPHTTSSARETDASQPEPTHNAPRGARRAAMTTHNARRDTWRTTGSNQRT